jgi:hypothetical protein
MTRKLIITLFLVPALFSCFDDIDNYDAPDSTITGVVTDNTTNEGIQTEQPNGFRFRLIESGYDNVVPLDFWGKPDGSFFNSQLFANTYEVGPIEGPFLAPPTQSVAISGVTEVNFTVTPFMTIQASAPTVSGKNIIVKYTLSKPGPVTYNIVKSSVLAATIPGVSNAVNNYRADRSLSGMTYAQIVGTEFTDVLENLPSGTYYVRVGGLTSNPLGKYNYSKVVQVTVP